MNSPKATAPVICFGESGWEIVSGTQFPGGLSITLPYHLNKFGFTVMPVTRIGIDDAGKNLIRFMEQNAVGTEYFQLDYELMTGKMIRSEHNGTYQNELPREVAWDKIIWDTAFEQLFTPDACLIYNSVAARDPLTRHTLFEMLQAVPKRVLLLGLNPPYYTKKIVEQCMKGTYVMQLTNEELELVTGWFADYATPEDRIRVLQERFQVPYIVVTKGSRGGLLNAEGVIYYHYGFRGQTTEETGSMDAFLAGLLKGLFLHQRAEDALQFACALGHLVATLPGACPEYEVDAVGKLIARNDIIS